jgi:hypothetical protein
MIKVDVKIKSDKYLRMERVDKQIFEDEESR